MKNALIKIGLTILCAAIYNAVNLHPNEISGIILSLIFLGLLVAIWRRNFTNTDKTKQL
jgi:hypothetical protein